MRLRHPSPSLVVALAALVVALGGAAIAAVPANDGDIHFCYSKRTGAVTVVDIQRDQFGCPQNWRGFIADTTPSQVRSSEDVTVTAGKDVRTTAGTNLVEDAGKDLTQTIGKDAKLTAGESIELKVGDASLKMRKDGTITLNGSAITINGTSVSVNAAGDVTIKGSKVSGN